MLRRLWIEWRGLIIFLVVMVLFRSAIADWNQVPTGSMKPTILEGDRVIVNKMAFGLRVPLTSIQLMRWGNPAAGDIITFISPEDDQLLIKRVIGVPGDWVAMVNNQLSINGESADYQALKILISMNSVRSTDTATDFFWKPPLCPNGPLCLSHRRFHRSTALAPSKCPAINIWCWATIVITAKTLALSALCQRTELQAELIR